MNSLWIACWGSWKCCAPMIARKIIRKFCHCVFLQPKQLSAYSMFWWGMAVKKTFGQEEILWSFPILFHIWVIQIKLKIFVVTIIILPTEMCLHFLKYCPFGKNKWVKDELKMSQISKKSVHYTCVSDWGGDRFRSGSSVHGLVDWNWSTSICICLQTSKQVYRSMQGEGGYLENMLVLDYK